MENPELANTSTNMTQNPSPQENVNLSISFSSPNKRLKIVLSVLLVLLLGGGLVYGGYLIGKNSKLKTQDSRLQLKTQILTPTPQPTEFPSRKTPRKSVLTGKWLNFNDPQLPFSFSYPEEMAVEASERIIVLKFFGPTQRNDTEIYDGIYLRFSRKEILQQETLRDYVKAQVEDKQKAGAGIIEPITEIILNADVSGLKFTTKELGTITYIYLLSPSGEIIEIIKSVADPTNQGFEGIVSQILQTFRFL